MKLAALVVLALGLARPGVAGAAVERFFRGGSDGGVVSRFAVRGARLRGMRL